MSAVIERPVFAPKFQIGDVVYRASVNGSGARYPCPDCKDTRKWSATSPAGHTMEMDCPRCTRNSGWNDDLSLNYTKYVISVERLTIGSVRIDTADKEHPIAYMCVETGVGSGTIHYEENLHANQESAEIDANIHRAEKQRTSDALPAQMTAAKHSTICYFDSLRESIRCSIDKDVRAALRSEFATDTLYGERTPGTWVANCDTDDSGVVHIEVYAKTPDDTFGLRVCSGYGGLSSSFASHAEAPANARLIAAAPDLLDAAQIALSNLHRNLLDEARFSGDDEHEAIAVLTAAIAKAVQP